MDNRELIDYGRKYVQGIREGLGAQGLEPADPLSKLLGDFENLFDRLEAAEEHIQRLEKENENLRANAAVLDGLDMGDHYAVKKDPYERLMVLIDPALKGYYGL